MASSFISVRRNGSRAPSPIPLRSTASGDVEALPEYDASLLDDHPLRSSPGQCCPLLLFYLKTCYSAARKNWNERVFRIVCVLLMILYANSPLLRLHCVTCH